MKMIKNFTLIVVYLVGVLWIGLGRNPAYYDKYTVTRTKVGYVVFALAALLISVSITLWANHRLQ